MCVRVRKFSRKAQADGGKLCLRFVETGAGREASEHVDLWSLTPLELSQIQPERNPCIVGNRNLKPSGMTPTTVTGVVPKCIFCPTIAGSPPKRDRQMSYARTTTGSRRHVRPNRGAACR